MFVGFGSKTAQVVFAGSGCERNPLVRSKVALLTDGSCSYFKKVHCTTGMGSHFQFHHPPQFVRSFCILYSQVLSMQSSGALGVIVVANVGEVGEALFLALLRL